MAGWCSNAGACLVTAHMLLPHEGLSSGALQGLQGAHHVTAASPAERTLRAAAEGRLGTGKMPALQAAHAGDSKAPWGVLFCHYVYH